MNKMPNAIFQNVPSYRPGRSLHDLSYEKKLSCDMGQLIPVMCDEVVPGDVIEIGNQALIRFQPLVAPIMHEINMFTHYFFVPYRLLWDTWETYITGGVAGTDASTLPTWEPTDTTVGSLWDYLGFPTGVDPDGLYPMDFPRRAYNTVYNEFYRDENLITEVALTNESILLRSWEKDYFTSALPWQQRGTAPAIPITGSSSAVWDSGVLDTGAEANYLQLRSASVDNKFHHADANVRANILGALNDNTVALGSGTICDMADLRLAMQIQRFMERNARTGVRYTEFLQAGFGVSPRDDRLQRPEYIGGSKSPIIISEVLQTSETGATTAQGNLAGHGIGVTDGFVGKVKILEYGLILGIMSIMPRTAYSQGINRQWLKTTRYDFYHPEFANLSEQEVVRGEIYANNVSADNNTLFGYQGAYDELRFKPSMICGQFRSTFDYWHLGRQFGAAPSLNQTFVECVPRKDIFAVPTDPGILVQYANLIKALRPIPYLANPGGLDHTY